MTCVECHRPFRWRGPNEHGVEQGWYRAHTDGPNGPRCHDRNACARAASENAPTLFG